MRQVLFTVLASFFLFPFPACGTGPADGEAEPEELPPAPDRDDDGLSDHDEEALGTDPDVPDSDGDGYLDGDEVAEGSDPLDPDSGIYIGGWPYNRDKDAIDDPGWDSIATWGAVIPNLDGIDQFGQVVQLYDFAGLGVPVFIDLSPEWCAPCHALAEWLEGDEDRLVDMPWWNPDWAGIPELVASGQLIWITVIHQDGNGEWPVDAGASERWYEEHTMPNIPVLADPDSHLWYWLEPTGYPNGNVVDENMLMLTVDNRGVDDALDLIAKMF